MIINVIASLLF